MKTPCEKPNNAVRGGSRSCATVLCPWEWRPRRSVALRALSVTACLFTLACSTSHPRVLEVTGRTRLQDVDPNDKELFVYDAASRIRYEPQDLSIEDQREEFYVRWTSTPTPRSGPASITLVKFEYRQVAKPNTVFEKTYTPQGDSARVFEVRGEEFRSGGHVSAWRVSLWDGDQLVAEKKSFLW